MTIIDLRTMRESSPPPFSVICLGNFDGVHIGHQALVRAAKEKKSELSATFPDIASSVCFFKIPPTDYFPEARIPRLMTLEQKLLFFSRLGLDFAFVADFEELRDTSPESYVKDTLKNQLHCVFAVCGFNFRYGKNAVGTAEELVRLMDGAASVIDPVCVNGNPVSSSTIRQAIDAGDAERAAILLGRPYRVEAEVLHGKALGRTLGLPTVNQVFPEHLAIPQNGIYVTRTYVDGVAYHSVSNVGIRPSIDDGTAVNCETHILDFDRNVYGKTVAVEFLKRIRDEIHFNDLNTLQAQIQSDIEFTKAYYKEA